MITQTMTKHQILKVQKLNTFRTQVKNPKATYKHVTIEDILRHCEISPKAIILIANLTFFLQNQRDRAKFIREYENQLLRKEAKKTSIMMALAREVGSYHYTYSSLEQLEKMNLHDALQHLFKQPVNVVMERGFIDSKATLKEMYELKQVNPKLLLMNALLCV